MGIEQANTGIGREAARGLRRSATREERKIEKLIGHHLEKGAKRFEELSMSSDGHGAGEKQQR